ncbi:hypothetical protein AB0I81_27910 [Nonomuraea sp. NPDC050404]|uniref:hypothetical protein n=1 Tax=Nonomuraea sp. NPDC050404 TaxID=3155783 RepID=UPI0033D5DD4D
MGKPAKEETYMLKPSCPSWDVDTGGRSVEELVTFFNGLDATQGVSKAATSYEEARKAIIKAQGEIKTQAIALEKVWEGEASVEAQTALGILHVTMGRLVEAMEPMHQAMDGLTEVVKHHKAFMQDGSKGILSTWHGGGSNSSWNDSIPDIYSTYKGYYKQGAVAGTGDAVENNADHDFGSPDELAGLHLQTFGQDLQAVYARMPNSIETAIPDIKPAEPTIEKPPPVNYPTPNADVRQPYSGSPYTPTSGSPQTPNFDGSIPNTDGPSYTPPNSTNPDTPPVNQPGTPSPNTPGTPSPNTPGTPDPNQPTNPNGQTPTVPGTTNPGQDPNNPAANVPKTSLQDYQPSTNLPNVGNPPNSTPNYNTLNTPQTQYSPNTPSGPATFGGTTGGVGGSLATPAAANAGTRGANGMGGMPFMPMGMGAGAGAQGEQDRESTTWLHEDDDVWGGDTDSVVNSKIG